MEQWKTENVLRNFTENANKESGYFSEIDKNFDFLRKRKLQLAIFSQLKLKIKNKS